MRKLTLLFILAFLIQFCHGQETNTKTGVPIYLDLFGGFTIGNPSGIASGISINYQVKKDLFTLRYIHIFDKKNALPFLAFLPDEIQINEIGALYGKRFLFDRSALTVSFGISSSQFKYKTEESVNAYGRKSYIGLPFEASIASNKNKNERFAALFGAKLFGNIGETSYIGLGFNIGIGWHKRNKNVH